jgi:hypothetical protein
VEVKVIMKIAFCYLHTSVNTHMYEVQMLKQIVLKIRDFQTLFWPCPGVAPYISQEKYRDLKLLQTGEFSTKNRNSANLTKFQ